MKRKTPAQIVRALIPKHRYIADDVLVLLAIINLPYAHHVMDIWKVTRLSVLRIQMARTRLQKAGIVEKRGHVRGDTAFGGSKICWGLGPVAHRMLHGGVEISS